MPTARSLEAPLNYVNRTSRQRTTSRQAVAVRTVGPLMLVELPDCTLQTLIARDGEATFAPGSHVLVGNPHGSPGSQGIIQGPVPGNAGISSFSILSDELFAVEPHIFSASPDAIEVGKTTPDVLLIGTGFSDDPVDTFVPVLFDSTDEVVLLDTLVTFGTVTFVPDPTVEGLFGLGESVTVVKLDVTVDAAHATGNFAVASEFAFIRAMVSRS